MSKFVKETVETKVTKKLVGGRFDARDLTELIYELTAVRDYLKENQSNA